MKKLNGLYPVSLTDDVAGRGDFFVEHLGFRETFTSDWYVSLLQAGYEAYELAVISHDHGTIPEDYRPGRLQNPDLRPAAQLRGPQRPRRVRPLAGRGGGGPPAVKGSTRGQQHFICRAPGGVMVDVIEVIPPSEEYAGGYVS